MEASTLLFHHKDAKNKSTDLSQQLTILPGITFPKEDELLSSWIFRLSKLNYAKTHTFCRFHFKNIEVWNRDIDKLATEALIQRLALLTTVPIERVRETTIKSYEGNLFEYCNAYGNQKWILPLKIFHRTRGRYGQQFCPSCLKNDEKEPYFRKSWRLASSVACPKCEILLHDRCPFCEHPISFFRNELGSKLSIASYPINYCYACKNDLSKSPRYPAKIGTVSYQKKLQRYLNLGHTPTLPYALQYFEVLYQVVKLLTIRGTKYKKFQQTILGFHSDQVYSKEEYQRIEFEKLSPIERENYLPIAMWLLEQWPNRFTEVCKNVSLSSAFIIKDFNQIPYWFHKEVFHNLFYPNPIIQKATK